MSRSSITTTSLVNFNLKYDDKSTNYHIRTWITMIYLDVPDSHLLKRSRVPQVGSSTTGVGA